MRKDLPGGEAALRKQLCDRFGGRLSLTVRDIVVCEASQKANMLLLVGNSGTSLGLLFVRFLLLLFLLSTVDTTRSNCGVVFVTVTIFIVAFFFVLKGIY